MKQKDIALFLVIGIFSAVFSVLLSNFLITPEKNKQQKVEVVEPITAVFDAPEQNDPYFNANSFNPTQLIQIGDGQNEKPFSQ